MCETSFEPSEPSAQQAADVDVGEVRVGAALSRRHADLRRGGVIVELDEEAFEQLARPIRVVSVPSARPLRRTAAGAGRDGPGLNESQPFSSVITARWQNQ